MSNSARRSSRSRSSDSASRREGASSTTRSYSGPKPSCSRARRRELTADQTIPATTTIATSAITIQIHESIRDPLSASGAETKRRQGGRSLRRRTRTSAQLGADELAHDARIRAAAGLLHHLADEEAEEALLAAAVLLDLPRVGSEDPVDERPELGRVGDGLLRQVRLGGEAGVARTRHRLVECLPRDAVARLDELRELGRVDGGRVDARAGELVHDDVRDGAPVARRRLVERIAPGRHEPLRGGEVELLLEAADPRTRELAQLRPHPLDELCRRLDRNEVGLREVAVVVGLLLRAPRGEPAGVDVEVVRLLDDLLAGLPD